MSNIGDKKISEICELPETQLGEMIARTQMATRIESADQELTADLVKRAMGSRTQRKFAEDIGVNVSSVSRILNGQFAEISPQLLAKIAFNADHESNVTLDSLMEAQGLCDPNDRGRMAEKYEEDCRRILVDELLKRGYTVKYEEQQSMNNSSRMMCDFSLITDALGKKDSRWLFECKMMSQYSILPVGFGRSQIWMDSAMAFYYRGGQVERISLVVDYRVVFEQLKARMSELKIQNEISVIFIDHRTGRILDEYVAPLSDGRIPQFMFIRDESTGK